MHLPARSSANAQRREKNGIKRCMEQSGQKNEKEMKLKEKFYGFWLLLFLAGFLSSFPFSFCESSPKITDTLLTVWLAIMRVKEAHPARTHRCLRVLTRNHRTRPVWLLCARMDFFVAVFSFLFFFGGIQQCCEYSWYICRHIARIIHTGDKINFQ